MSQICSLACLVFSTYADSTREREKKKKKHNTTNRKMLNTPWDVSGLRWHVTIGCLEIIQLIMMRHISTLTIHRVKQSVGITMLLLLIIIIKKIRKEVEEMILAFEKTDYIIA